MVLEADIKENWLQALNPELLNILLHDNSSKRNIIWATNDYEYLGEGYGFLDEIRPELITADNGNVIQPRTQKPILVQQQRIRDNGEVFTPSWVCNAQNNLIDDEWFGFSGAFNIEIEQGWISTRKVKYQGLYGKRHQVWWREYIKLNRMEIACGEAPYITSRYDAVTGETIAVPDRIGLLDRKLRIVNEHTSGRKKENWFKYALNAVKSVYGFDYQGDNVFIARENVLADIMEFYEHKWQEQIPMEWMMQFAEIISWNIWQMDGLKYVIPNSCYEEEAADMGSLFESSSEIKKMLPCKGCSKENPHAHNGIYCNIREWDMDTPNGKKNLGYKVLPFHTMIKA